MVYRNKDLRLQGIYLLRLNGRWCIAHKSSSASPLHFRSDLLSSDDAGEAINSPKNKVTIYCVLCT